MTSSSASPDTPSAPTLADLIVDTLDSGVLSNNNSPFSAFSSPGHPHVLVMTGPNASGKSLAFRVLSIKAHDAKVSPITISIRERTGAGTHEMSGMRRMMMFGDESEQSTGATSLGTVRKGFGNLKSRTDEGKPVLLMLDEPEQGLSEDYAAAMGTWLAQQVAEHAHPLVVGVVIVTHSRPLVRALVAELGQDPSWVSMEREQSVQQWLDTPVERTVADLLALEKTGLERWRAVGQMIQENKAAKAKPNPDPPDDPSDHAPRRRKHADGRP